MSHNVDLITFDIAITVEFMIAISLTIEIVLSDIAGFDMFLSSGFFFLGAANEIFHWWSYCQASFPREQFWILWILEFAQWWSLSGSVAWCTVRCSTDRLNVRFEIIDWCRSFRCLIFFICQRIAQVHWVCLICRSLPGQLQERRCGSLCHWLTVWRSTDGWTSGRRWLFQLPDG